MELARERAREVVVVELERVARVDERAAVHENRRVHLLAVVLAREAERELPVDADRRAALADDGVADVGVAVLDHDPPGGRAPLDVPGPHAVAGESTLDARVPEVVQHHAVEPAVPPDRHGVGRRAERRHDRRQQAVALLPVGARQVERDSRALAVGRLPLERDEGGRRGHVARRQGEGVGAEGVIHGPAHRLVAERPARVEGPHLGRPRLGGGHDGRRQHPRQDRGPVRRHGRDRAVAVVLGEAAQAPLEAVASGGAPGQAHVAAEEVRELGEVHVLVAGVEARGRAAGRAERRQDVVEGGAPAVEPRGGVGHLEAVRQPQQRPGEAGERVVVDRGRGAREAAPQLAPALVEVEGAVEVALAGHAPRLAGEEDLAHAREVHARVHVIELLRPVRDVDVSGEHGPGAVGRQVDAVQVDLRAVDDEAGLHRRGHRQERLDLHDAAGERRAADVLAARARDEHRQVRADDAPRRAVVDEGEASVVGTHHLHRGHEPARAGRPVLGGELRQRVPAVGERLDHHVPVGHVHRLHDELAREDRPPRQRDGDAPGLEEGPVGRGEPLDHHVVELELAGEEPHREAADVHGPLHVARGGLLGAAAEHGPEVHAERAGEERRDERGRDEQHTTGVVSHARRAARRGRRRLGILCRHGAVRAGAGSPGGGLSGRAPAPVIR
jgi:hypothetical protein